MSLYHLQVIQFAKPLEMSPDNCWEKSTFVQTADLQFLILLKLGCLSQYISNFLETFSSCFTDHYRSTNFYEEYMGQSIQEWSTLNLWKTAFKKFKWGMVCFRFFKGRLHNFYLVRSWILCPIQSWQSSFLKISYITRDSIVL